PQGRLSVESATLVVPGRQSPLLLDVNFELRPGDMLGIVGPSGAGKTSLARCLVGLQPLSRGHVRIDDASLADWPADQIGHYIGYLPQRVELFDGTIAENIATMDEQASPAAVIEAAKRAEVHELIVDIPGGYNAPVGLRGELLSGGQRQRIGLARAFYGDKRLIVLDEPNANLDPDGEEALARAVSNAAERGAAVVVVTHRLNILRRLSHAAVMNDGRLVRFGAAREIVDGAAQPMFMRQGRGDPKVATLDGTARRGRWGAERSACAPGPCRRAGRSARASASSPKSRPERSWRRRRRSSAATSPRCCCWRSRFSAASGHGLPSARSTARSLPTARSRSRATSRSSNTSRAA